MPEPLATEADFVLAGYQTGYYAIDDVIAWADRWILALEEPPTELLDVSMGRGLYPRELIKLLRSLGNRDERVIIAAELGMIGARLREGEIEVIEASNLLWPLHDHPDATRDEIFTVYCVADDIHYALNEGVGNLKDIESRLHQFLTPYTDQLRSHGHLPT